MIPYPAFKLDKVLCKGAPCRVYGTLGDAFLQKRVTDALLGKALDADSRDFNFDALDGESTTLADFLARAGNLPFLSDHRVVMVTRAERMEGLQKAGDDGENTPVEKPDGKTKTKAKSSPVKRLCDGLENLPPTTIVIFSRTPETPEPGARATTPRCVHATVDKTIEKHGHIIDCTIGAKNGALATATLEKYASEEHIPLARDAASHLVARSGHDIARLFSELEKCALRAGIGEPVTQHIIDEMVRRTPQETIFDLTDALGERRAPRVIALLRDLIGSGEAPELILAMLVRHLRQLLQARAFLDARLPLDGSTLSRLPRALAEQLPRDGRDNLANLLQSQNWLGRRLSAQAQNFSTPQLQAALSSALAADLAFKGIEGDGGEPAMLLELMVTRMC